MKYKVDDIDTIRQNIYSSVLDAVSGNSKIEDDDYVFSIEELDYEGPESIDPEKEKEAILTGGTVYRPLRGTVRLYDKKTGQLISEERKRIAAVPYITPRGTFILNGVEYGVINQMRLRPGVYTRLTNDGEYEALINVAKGVGHRYVFDPTSGVFYLKSGQARVPLYPFLRALGISDQQLQKVWGSEILKINQEQADNTAIRRAALAIFGRQIKAATDEDLVKRIRELYGTLEVDPNVNAITLNRPSKTLDSETVLRITQKLLQGARGEETIDDRNHIAFLKAIGPEDLLREAIQKNVNRLRNYYNRVRARRNVRYFPTGIFDDAIRESIYGSGLGNALQEINPLEILDNRYRTTRMGEGGITNVWQVTDDNRYNHPSFVGFIDPIVTPEGLNVGVDVRFGTGVRRDEHGNIYSTFVDAKTNKKVELTPQQLFNKVVTFESALAENTPLVPAIINNQHILVPRKEIDYIVSDVEKAYSPLSNLIPMKQNSYPQRVSMGARMITQAVPLVDPEAPFVQNLSTVHGKSYEKLYGEQLGTRKSSVNGVVTRVTQDAIFIKDEQGNSVRIPYYRNFPYNRKTFYTETPVVKAGDPVKRGDILTKSNYVDNNYATALGKNLKTAYIPWEGYNFEDAAVISESAAKKLESEHMYQKWVDLTPDMATRTSKFMAIFPGKYPKSFYEKYTEDGIPKPGAILEKGDPIALIASKVPIVAGKSGSRAAFRDDSPVWEYDDPAEVVTAAIGPKHINVVLRARHPLRVGDKISGRYGDKHIISVIMPDEQMPKDENGEPFELLLNPLGVQGRVNVSQLWELLLGNIAKKTGKPIEIPDFTSNMPETVRRLLQEHGIPDKVKIFLEKQNTTVEAPAGYRYVMKLHHLSESKLSGRGTGGYSSEEVPVKGGFTGAKRIGMLEMLGLLAHGAYHTARDARVVRGQKNEDYWTRVKLGYDIPSIQEVPFVYDKFMNQLIASGLYPKEKAGTIGLFALTNKDIRDLTGDRTIKNAGVIELSGGGIKVSEGGFFDPKITGGLNGRFWSVIPLAEPMPNPMAEPVLRTLLGLTQKQYHEVIAGERELPGYGKGTEALKNALADIDLDKQIQREEENLTRLKGNSYDQALRRLKILKAFKTFNKRPEDLIWDRVPVIPPVFRPTGMLSTGNVPLVSDLNFLYKDLYEVNEALSELKKAKIDDPSDRRLLYAALQAVVGLGEPVHPKLKAQNIKGALKQIIGSSPKFGVVQKKLLGAQVDLVGRATIIPNPNLDLDEVAIPEEAAWEIYKPFIIRGLIRKGATPTQAIEALEKKTDKAKDILLQEMNNRPVIISRAPVLHKYGILAAWPKLTKNKVMEIHPFLVTGFGADFDGDAMQFHVPVDPAAVKEAIDKLLPSKNVISFQRFQAHAVPTMEYALGLHYLSSRKAKGDPVVFKNRHELLEALRSGKITPDQAVILEEK